MKAGAGAKLDNLPLAWAAVANKMEIAKVLLVHRPKFDLKGFGETTFLVAVRTNNDSITRLFIERGANINTKDKLGWSLLALAKLQKWRGY